MKRALFALALIILAAAPVAGAAHRLHAALTTVEWRDSAGSLEVTHRLFAHDFEQWLGRNAPGEGRDLAHLEARARAALYAERHFALSNGEGEAIPLTTLGAETEGEYLYVYQEALMDSPPAGLTVDNSLLHDLWRDQINHVNIDLGQGVKTLIFTKGDPARRIENETAGGNSQDADAFPQSQPDQQSEGLSMINFIIFILIGILAGWIAEQIMKRDHGLVINLVVGVIGALIGGWLFSVLGIGVTNIIIQIIAAVIGACLLLFIIGLIRRKT